MSRSQSVLFAINDEDFSVLASVLDAVTSRFILLPMRVDFFQLFILSVVDKSKSASVF